MQDSRSSATQARLITLQHHVYIDGRFFFVITSHLPDPQHLPHEVHKVPLYHHHRVALSEQRDLCSRSHFSFGFGFGFRIRFRFFFSVGFRLFVFGYGFDVGFGFGFGSVSIFEFGFGFGRLFAVSVSVSVFGHRLPFPFRFRSRLGCFWFVFGLVPFRSRWVKRETAAARSAKWSVAQDTSTRRCRHET